jgi:hypothetical protein
VSPNPNQMSIIVPAEDVPFPSERIGSSCRCHHHFGRYRFSAGDNNHLISICTLRRVQIVRMWTPNNTTRAAPENLLPGQTFEMRVHALFQASRSVNASLPVQTRFVTVSCETYETDSTPRSPSPSDLSSKLGGVRWRWSCPPKVLVVSNKVSASPIDTPNDASS